MCGITGWLDFRGFRDPDAHPVIRAMTGALRHRGPDDDGTWLDGRAGIALGFRRLAILDLSSAGRQPMHSASGRYTIAFNGEIYNFRSLRRELEGRHRFRGHSDTEVLLAAVSEWGVRGAVDRFNGMFAFALWDSSERVLHLCRDRGGEKPLYYGWMGGTLLFASELKALRHHPLFRGEIDRGALARFLRRRYLAAPLTIYQGIFKLPAGTFLRVSANQRRPVPESYWSWREIAERGAEAPFRGTAREALDEFDALLRDAIQMRLESDVPLGAFLSGGLDSSLIVAMMQAMSARRVRTFTIGFRERRYDEAVHAAAVAKYLGTDHTEMYVTPAEAMAVIPRLPTLYDEPFADSSQVPTALLSALTRRHVTVCLSGDAGDELFGGYRKYWRAALLSRILSGVPRSGRNTTVALLRAVSRQNGWLADAVNSVGRAFSRSRSVTERLDRAAEMLSADPPRALFHRMMSYWNESAGVVLNGNEPQDIVATPDQWPELPSVAEQIMYADAVTWLEGDILAKVDRASMGVGLETRIPLLDPRIIAFACRLPLAFKMRGRTGKWILRQLAHRYVPRRLLDRPKHGFDIPVSAWLRGPLRPWAEALLDEHRLSREGYLAPGPVRRRWTDHLTGRTNRHYGLWSVLMFQAWLEAQQQDATTTPVRSRAPSTSIV